MGLAHRELDVDTIRKILCVCVGVYANAYRCTEVCRAQLFKISIFFVFVFFYADTDRRTTTIMVALTVI